MTVSSKKRLKKVKISTQKPHVGVKHELNLSKSNFVIVSYIFFIKSAISSQSSISSWVYTTSCNELPK